MTLRTKAWDAGVTAFRLFFWLLVLGGLWIWLIILPAIGVLALTGVLR